MRTLPEHADGALGRDTRTVAGITLVSRFMGLARDLVTVRVFGDTAVGSAFAAAFAIPNMFRRLFGEGALSAAFIPEYTRLADRDPDRADRLASLTVGVLALFTGAVTVVIELGLLAIILMAPGDEERALSLRLIMVCLPFMPMICIAAILGGMLQSKGRFAPWAAAPVILNLCIIAVALPALTSDRDPAFWAYPIAAAATISGALQVFWSLWALRGTVRWTRAVGDARAQGVAMLRRMGPVLIGLGTLQLNSFADTLIAMWPNWVGPTIAGRPYPLDESANAILFYAQRLYQFPLGVFGIAVATAAFPMLSRDASDPARFVSTIRRGARLSLFIALPATAGLLVVRQPLVAVMFSGVGDGFSDEGVRRAAAVLAGYSAAVWAYSLNQLLTRAFYAAGDTRTPMRIALWMVALNLTLNMVLIWWFQEAGLAWSTAVSAVVQTVLLTRAARARLVQGPLLDADTTRVVLGQLAGAGLTAGASWGVLALWPRPDDWAQNASRTAACVIAGMVVYAAWSVARRCPELRWLLGRSTSGTIAGPTDTDDRNDPGV